VTQWSKLGRLSSILDTDLTTSIVARMHLHPSVMHPPNIHPSTPIADMVIPEIREVAVYLRLSGVCACALVCKEWDDSFTPLLCREISNLNLRSPGIERLRVLARKLSLITSTP